ncbi:MAG: transposase [Symbiobacteriaceae bacterium]|nr:transposase [Symbiobacteriaceae bacterium]
MEDTYSHTGRPSIDPVILVKIVIIQYLFGIRSMRQTIRDRKRYPVRGQHAYQSKCQ